MELPVYKQGEWAEIIKEESIQIGDHKVEFKNGEVKIGCKQFTKSDAILVKGMSDLCNESGMWFSFDGDGSLACDDIDSDHTSPIYEISVKTLNKILANLKD